ncbi:hypothetical protein HMPREF9306_01233 [Propionimicrobium lymphophilum ACS-093-V-SCH5]|uniref:SCP domain-containing protein n=1 Tax=Propionimicrobium lymphophilum ACS-093-V-SCH5 TaxID=883161 RepID=S2W3J9_9ACTN|nr:CAP domain-containing protein [Propionimicrobium lymphophilum]EPD32925.1 hypothetical protein HMPREF9306_01233 [Propionimicrobium lymphophilum ACS-093-V-SCH5]
MSIKTFKKVTAVSVPALLAVAIIGGCAASNSSNEAQPTKSPSASASASKTPKAESKAPVEKSKAPGFGEIVESSDSSMTVSLPGGGQATVRVPDSYVQVQARAPMTVPTIWHNYTTNSTNAGNTVNTGGSAAPSIPNKPAPKPETKLEKLLAKRTEALDAWNKAKNELNAAKDAKAAAEDAVAKAQQAIADAKANEAKAAKAADALAKAKDGLKAAKDAAAAAHSKVADAQARLSDAVANASKADQAVADSMKQGDFDWAKLSKSETETLVAAIVQENINAYRAQAGLPPLPVTVELNQSAYNWSKHMSDTKNQRSKDNWLVHADLGNAEQVLCDQPMVDGCWGVNENIAYRSYRGTPRDMAVGLFNMWKNSPGHNANMLSNTKNHAAIGVFIDSNGTYWATSRSYSFEDQKPGAYMPDNAGLIGESTTAGAEAYSGDRKSQASDIKVFHADKKAEQVASTGKEPGDSTEAAKAAAKAAHEKVDEAKAEVAAAEADAGVADSNVNAAKAKVDEAQAEVNQLPDPATGQANLDAAKAEVEAASAKVETAEANEQAAHKAYDAADAAYQAEANPAPAPAPTKPGNKVVEVEVTQEGPDGFDNDASAIVEFGN